MRYGSDIPGQLTPTDIAMYQLYIEKERAKLGKELLRYQFLLNLFFWGGGGGVGGIKITLSVLLSIFLVRATSSKQINNIDETLHSYSIQPLRMCMKEDNLRSKLFQGR